MEEAQVLADRAAIIVGGRLVAEGPPNRLGNEAGVNEIRFRLPAGTAMADLPLAADAKVESDGRFVTVRTGDPITALNELTGWALQHGADLAPLSVGMPSLEDVYLELTEDRPE